MTPKKNATIILDISKTVLATMLGTSRENLSRLFSKLQNLKIIKVTNKQITIYDYNKLQAIINNKLSIT
jgi:CRP-like cAMP-binding protein